MTVYEVVKGGFFVGALTVHGDRLTLLEGPELRDQFRELRELCGIPVSVKESGGLCRVYLMDHDRSVKKIMPLVRGWLQSRGYKMTVGF